VALIVPVYVADDARRARQEPEASTMHFFRTIAEALAKGGTDREERARRLGQMTYDEILGDLVVYGTPEAVTERLLELQEALGYSILSVWMNVGGRIPHEKVLDSMRLFAERVAPRLSSTA
jgi:alkanesulfonate monooxygenase SsuD/methylene tetrahydromethanopterin reductase-like flavin-dependent oxidoreductase (luciferase family)